MPQLPHLSVDDRELLPQGGKAALGGVVFQQFPNFLQGKAAFFQDKNGVQFIQLGSAVITVAVLGVHISGLKQPRFIIEDQCLLGDVLIMGQFPTGNLADRKIIFHAEAPP